MAPYPPLTSYPPVPIDNAFTFVKKTHTDTYPFITPSPKDQNGRYVLITGASRGIGLATAISFAKAGAAGIAVCARTTPADITEQLVQAAKSSGASPPEVLNLKLDINNYADVEAAAAAVEKAWGQLDILVNNAGYLSPFVPLLESKIDEYWLNYELNIRGVYWVTRAFIPLLLKSTEKTILNIGSAGAHHLTPGASGYQTTKLALLRFTEFLMVDYIDDGLLAYTVHPGSVATPLAKTMPEEVHFILQDTPELAADALVAFSRERREWLAGRYVSVNWDLEEFLAKEKEIVEGDKLKIRLVV